jgi:hypothetical protein
VWSGVLIYQAPDGIEYGWNSLPLVEQDRLFIVSDYSGICLDDCALGRFI